MLIPSDLVRPLVPDLPLVEREKAQQFLLALSINARAGDFAKGVISLANVLFFLTIAGWLLLLTTAALGSKRWR